MIPSRRSKRTPLRSLIKYLENILDGEIYFYDIDEKENAIVIVYLEIRTDIV